MFSLVLGGCGSGTGVNSQDNAAVTGPTGQVDNGDKSGNVFPDDDSSLGPGKSGTEGNPTVVESHELTVHFIDVGQGDSILVQTPTGQSMLIDGGERDQGKKVVQYLKNQGLCNINILVGTHPHSDHIGGLIDVLENFPVDKVYLPKVIHNTPTFKDFLTAIKNKGLKATTAKAGIEIPLEGVDACFAAPVGDTYEDLNNYSTVIKILYGNNSFLFTGDAEEESEAEMLLSSVVCLQADVLKIGHHGSTSSTTDAFLEIVSPQYAVIMCGKNNDYGHPHEETIEKLTKAGIEIYRTDQQGNIVMTSDGNNIEINTVKSYKEVDENLNVQSGTGLNDQDNGDNTYYIGNKNSNKLHRPYCKYLPAEHNRVYFKTWEEAIEAGYVPCKACCGD